ncbi:MAG: hypothetical protein ABMB14_17055 [Myxococcota bacterium]
MEAEVRRCARCGQPMVVAVRTWDRQTSVYGLPTGTTPGGGGLQYACQGCGHGFLLAKPSLATWIVAPLGLMFVAIAALILVGGIVAMMPALLLVGAVTFGIGAAITWSMVGPFVHQLRNPVVPGAMVPPLRFTGAEPGRRCRCGQEARCVEVTANRTNGVYTGTEYAYRCGACDRTFTIESPMSAATMTIAGAVVGAIAYATVPTDAVEWSDWACPGITGFLAVAAVVMVTTRAVARIRHPQIPVRAPDPTD